MLHYLSRLSLCVFFAVGICACDYQPDVLHDFKRVINGDIGQPKQRPTEQIREQFVLPSMKDDGAPLALSGLDPFVSYTGTLLFWDTEQVTPVQIADVANASKAGRATKRQFLDAALSSVPALRLMLAQKSAEMSANDRALQMAQRDVEPARVREAMQEFVDGWVGERLNLAQSAAGLSDLDRLEIETQFSRYCEFKLWELATSPLIQQKFKHRPSPLSLCEPYFAKRGYFEHGESSDVCSEQNANGDWFECVWRQGVLKSQMMEQLANHATDSTNCATSGAARVRAIAGWLEPETDGRSLLYKIVAEPKKFQNKSLAEMLIKEGYPGLKNLLTASAGRAFRTLYPYVSRLSDCPEAFAVKGQRAIDPVALTLKLNAKNPVQSRTPVTIQELKNIGENLTPSQSEEALFAATPGREAQALQVLQLVVAPLTAYSERLASELGEDIRASYDDYALNELESGLIPLPTSHSGLLAIEGRIDANDQSAAFAGLRQVQERILRRHYGHLLEAKSRLNNELTAAQSDLTSAISELSRVVEAVQEENVEGTLAVSAPGATSFFNTFRLDLGTETGKLNVTLQIAEGKPFQGCSNLAQLIACPAALAEKGFPFRRIEFSESTGLLLLEVDLSSPAEQGFGLLPRGSEPGKFNEITSEQLLASKLRFEIYTNRLGDHFRFVTGKVFLIAQDDTRLLEGSFSADNYPMEKSRLGL